MCVYHILQIYIFCILSHFFVSYTSKYTVCFPGVLSSCTCCTVDHLMRVLDWTRPPAPSGGSSLRTSARDRPSSWRHRHDGESGPEHRPVGMLLLGEAEQRANTCLAASLAAASRRFRPQGGDGAVGGASASSTLCYIIYHNLLLQSQLTAGSHLPTGRNERVFIPLAEHAVRHLHLANRESHRREPATPPGIRTNCPV